MLAALSHRTFAILAGLVAAGAGAPAQTRWLVDSKLSLAWWQMSPHLNHLWATTCPEEPSWRPGEGRSGGWVISKNLRSVYSSGTTGDQNVADTINVPLYPRAKVGTVCTEAVAGELIVSDTTRWQSVRGVVVVKGAELISGEHRRDAYARNAVLQTSRYPDIRFTIDSVVNVTRQADTLSGTAVGVFTFHGAAQPMMATVRSWPEAGGRRVLAKFRIPAKRLTKDYGLSKFALGLGVGTKIWQDAFAGVDVLLRSEAPGAPGAN
jgi:YceI-like protein